MEERHEPTAGTARSSPSSARTAFWYCVGVWSRRPPGAGTKTGGGITGGAVALGDGEGGGGGTSGVSPMRPVQATVPSREHASARRPREGIGASVREKGRVRLSGDRGRAGTACRAGRTTPDPVRSGC